VAKNLPGFPIPKQQSRLVGGCNFPSNNFARHRGLLRARPYGNRRREDRRERRSSNHIVEEHERGNMNNISARRTAGESQGCGAKAMMPRREKKRETKRARHSLGRQRLRRRKKREGARVGTTPWLVGSFDLLPPRDGPLPPAIPLRAGSVSSRFRSLADRYRRLVPPVFSLPRDSAFSLFLLSSRDLSPAEKRRPTRQNHTFYDYPLTNNPKLRAVVLFSGSVESFERRWTPFVSAVSAACIGCIFWVLAA